MPPARFRPAFLLPVVLIPLLLLVIRPGGVEAAQGLRAGHSHAAGPRPPRVVSVPAGWFIRGSSLTEVRQALALFSATESRPSIRRALAQILAEEIPRRRIWLPAFDLDRQEVTNADYARCVKAGRCRAIGRPSSQGAFRRPSAPLVNVTWKEAVGYCSFRGRRLPTESEWEKAARGPLGRRFPWGENWHERACNHGTLHPLRDASFGSAGDGFFWVARAGSFAKDRSYYGAEDLGGNVSEWVADWHQRGHWARKNTPLRQPSGPATGTLRRLKGGSWQRLRIVTRGAARLQLDPTRRSPDVGFRCARSRR